MYSTISRRTHEDYCSAANRRTKHPAIFCEIFAIKVFYFVFHDFSQNPRRLLQCCQSPDKTSRDILRDICNKSFNFVFHDFSQNPRRLLQCANCRTKRPAIFCEIFAIKVFYFVFQDFSQNPRRLLQCCQSSDKTSRDILRDICNKRFLFCIPRFLAEPPNIVLRNSDCETLFRCTAPSCRLANRYKYSRGTNCLRLYRTGRTYFGIA